jgi:hypothetical protein
MARKLVTLLVIACFGTFVFAAAGCGGDDSSASGDTTETTETITTEDTETTDTETTETETTETEDTDTDTTETTETSDSGDFATSENCAEFAEIGQKVSAALTGSSDPDELKTAFEQLTAAAPDEIKDDFETLSQYVTEIADALGDVQAGETPDPSALAALQSLDATAATTASTNIATWAQENC